MHLDVQSVSCRPQKRQRKRSPRRRRKSLRQMGSKLVCNDQNGWTCKRFAIPFKSSPSREVQVATVAPVEVPEAPLWLPFVLLKIDRFVECWRTWCFLKYTFQCSSQKWGEASTRFLTQIFELWFPFFSTTANHLPPNMCWVLLVTNPGGGFKHFLFSSLFGEMIQFDEHIFQMGWFNHQQVTFLIWRVEFDLLHFFQVHIATVKPVPLVTVAPLPEVPIFSKGFYLPDGGGVSLGLFFFVNFDRYIFVGCGPFPGFQWQIKVYRDSLRKMEYSWWSLLLGRGHTQHIPVFWDMIQCCCCSCLLFGVFCGLRTHQHGAFDMSDRIQRFLFG